MILKRRVHTVLRTALRVLTSGGVSAVACFGAAVGVIANVRAADDVTKEATEWGYINTYTEGGKTYKAYVYTKVGSTWTFTVPPNVSELDYTANGRAGVTLDFTDHALTVGTVVFANAKGQTFAGGTFTFNAVDFAADRVSVTAEKRATVRLPLNTTYELVKSGNEL